MGVIEINCLKKIVFKGILHLNETDEALQNSPIFYFFTKFTVSEYRGHIYLNTLYNMWSPHILVFVTL